jgi:hypothetical protein
MWRAAAAVFASVAFGAPTAPPNSPSICNQGPTASQLAQVIHGRNGVVAVVGDSPISTYELIQRTAWRVATLTHPPSEVEVGRIEHQERSKLIRERRWVLLAQSRGVSVSKSEVDRRLADLLGQSGTTERQLHETLLRTGVDKSTLRVQIAAEIARAKVTGASMHDDLRMPRKECF